MPTMSELTIPTCQQIIEAHTPLEVPDGADFTLLQQRVLFFASLGYTAEEVSTEVRAKKIAVEKSRDALIAAYDVPNMAAVVNAALYYGQLPIVEREEGDMNGRLTARQKAALGFSAIGLTKGEIAAKFNKANADTFHKNVLRPAFSVLRASGRTHAVRRNYEYGIVTPAVKSS